MTQPLILHYAPDNASLCVRLALLELGLPFQTQLVDRSVAAQKSKAFLALNPNGLIPVLETPVGPLFETAAILIWLADRAPGSVFPAVTDPARGPALTRLFWLSNTLHTTLRMAFYPDQYAPTAHAAVRSHARARFDALLNQLEQAQRDAWLDSPEPSILACYLAPMLRWAALYGDAQGWQLTDARPRLLAFATQFDTRPAMQQAALAEGLGPTPISRPQPATPPEGTAT